MKRKINTLSVYWEAVPVGQFVRARTDTRSVHVREFYLYIIQSLRKYRIYNLPISLAHSERRMMTPRTSPLPIPPGSHEYDPNGDADVILYSDCSDCHSDSGSSPSPSLCSPPSEKEPPSDPESVEFHVHSAILSLASPRFKQILSPGRDGLSATRVAIPEPPRVLSTILRFLYPFPEPEILSLDDHVSVLSAAVKYQISAIVHSLRKQLMSDKFTDEDPVRVFAIAVRFNLEEEAKVASRRTLRIDLMDHPLSPDLHHISAHTYHLLLSLHKRRAASAISLLKLPYHIKCPQCNTGHATYNAPKWWYHFQRRAEAELQFRPGNTNVVFSPKFLLTSVKAVRDEGCESCPGSFLESVESLEKMKMAIDNLPDTI
ncbi:hypothetical protein D9757_002218 [Collybiopsis confluens]|uniref:BTB domain-containing protein n=1 Tax=Collybiopsis confluens TaxID=2823264 RepID=A0A8H5MG43_9AGAR|nr:hypothetical protein D9757_002218 [Collybiopsis confluens]